jgi:hypothetical protein
MQLEGKRLNKKGLSNKLLWNEELAENPANRKDAKKKR